MTTLWTLIAAERRALADDLAELADADWEARSLCTDWTIRDVVAHLTSWARLTPGPFLRSLVFHGFNLKSTMAEDMTRAAGASIHETLDNFRSVQDFVRPVPGGGAVSMLGETVVHAEDIRRPLGIQRSYPTEALTLIAGFDALSDTTEQRLIATDRAWVPPTDFRSLAPFGQANLKLFDGLVRLAGGARYENVKITIDDYTTLASAGRTFVAGGSPTFDDILLNGGVIVEPIKGIRAYASYAEGYTVPDVGRITRAVNTPGVDIDNFLDISPIVSNNRELGFEVKRGPLDASATYFWSSSTKGQLLIARPDGIFDVVRQRVEIEGLEINVAIRTPVDGLTLSTGYAHILGRFDADGNGAVETDLDGANISPDRLNLAASYAVGPLSARVQTQFYLARSFDGPNRDPRNGFGGYNLTDAIVRYQTGFGGISLAVQNLFDKQYISYASDTQRPTDNFFNFAGRGRSFTLGWDARF